MTNFHQKLQNPNYRHNQQCRNPKLTLFQLIRSCEEQGSVTLNCFGTCVCRTGPNPARMTSLWSTLWKGARTGERLQIPAATRVLMSPHQERNHKGLKEATLWHHTRSDGVLERIKFFRQFLCIHTDRLKVKQGHMTNFLWSVIPGVFVL